MISLDITNVCDYWNWLIRTKHKLCRLWWMWCKQRMLKQIKINTCPFFPFITLSPVLRGKCFHIIVVMGQETGMVLILVWEPQQVEKVSKGTQTCILGNNEQLCFDGKFYQLREMSCVLLEYFITETAQDWRFLPWYRSSCRTHLFRINEKIRNELFFRF